MVFHLKLQNDRFKSCWAEALGRLQAVRRKRVDNDELMDYLFGGRPELFPEKPGKPRQVEVPKRG